MHIYSTTQWHASESLITVLQYPPIMHK